MNFNKNSPLLATLLSQLLLALALPPICGGYLGPLVFVCLAPWFWALSQINLKQGLFVSFLGGMAFNLITYSWVLATIDLGSPYVVGVGYVVLSAYLTLYVLLQSFLFQKCLQFRFGLGVFPILWAGLEVVRTQGELSFPWNHLAYSLGHFLSFIQISSLIGVFGLGILILIPNLLLFTLLKNKDWDWAQKSMRIAAILLIPTLIYAYGEIRLEFATVPSSQKAKVALVQPSILQTEKWEYSYYRAVIDSTVAVVDRNPILAADQFDVVVFPETAIPNLWEYVRDDQSLFKSLAQKWNADIFIGVLTQSEHQEPGSSRQAIQNSGVLLHPNQSVEFFHKNHLVPFSEKVPYNQYYPWINKLDLGQSNFEPGTKIPVWNPKIRWSPNICYESIYPYILRKMVRQGTRLVVNITNDGWFKRSLAPAQHANMVIFRAVENAMPFARDANTGYSLMIDEYGRTLRTTALYDKTVLKGEIPLKSIHTLYSNIGDEVENLLAVFFWIGLVFLLFRRKT